MQPERIAGRYTVERAVGHGGMGTVWLCRDDVLHRMVAVKQVGNLPGESASDVNRALREARSSAALDHRNVVSVYDAVQDGEHNWLVMEYVASRTLSAILAEEGAMSPERATWIVLQAADGLAAAHARGTMHRDVKPGNILVTDDDHAKITDFGLSRAPGDAQLTRTGLISGTPAYFSPEIARGDEPGLAADVWALGATLYAAVEGEPAYPDQGNAIAMLTTIATTPPPLPRRAGPLTDPITAMMAPDPETRWSMADAARELRRLHTANGPARTVRTTRPAAAPVAAADSGPALAPSPAPTPASTPASMPTSMPASTPGSSPAGAPTPESPQRVEDPDRRRWLLPVVVIVLLAIGAAVGAPLLIGEDDPTPAASAPESRSSSPQPSPSPSPTTSSGDARTPRETTTPEPAPSPQVPTEDDEATPASPGDVEAFGARYYSLLPENTDAAYALLSPSYGSSFGSYNGFWRTIAAVDVRGVTAVDETTVDVAITYTGRDGSTEDETRRLFLQPTEDGYAIVSDSAV